MPFGEDMRVPLIRYVKEFLCVGWFVSCRFILVSECSDTCDIKVLIDCCILPRCLIFIHLFLIDFFNDIVPFIS